MAQLWGLEEVGGSIEGFAELMNKKAEELGLQDTRFVTPHGLDKDGHYTTSYELALLADYAEDLSALRKKEALKLEQEIVEALHDLNFMQAEFQVSFEEAEQIGVNGKDKVVFMISTNPGEKLRPLSAVASGGELSRIMLAIKTISAKRDDINTLIFDEIDSGISGKTAWKVSEKLGLLSMSHQIICITHLPQIAAMADSHYCIEKSEQNGKTVTDIKPLTEAGALNEVARLLGGEVITGAVLENAKELKMQAQNTKNG